MCGHLAQVGFRLGGTLVLLSDVGSAAPFAGEARCHLHLGLTDRHAWLVEEQGPGHESGFSSPTGAGPQVVWREGWGSVRCIQAQERQAQEYWAQWHQDVARMTGHEEPRGHTPPVLCPGSAPLEDRQVPGSPFHAPGTLTRRGIKGA